MKLILIHNLKPGMIIGKDVFAGNGLLLMPAGTVLDSSSISTLRLHSITAIYIKETAPVSIPTPETTKNFEQFAQEFERTTVVLQNQINEVVTKNICFCPESLLSETSTLFSEDMTAIGLFSMLHNMRNYDDSTFVHSVNVALICNVFGKWLQLPPEELEVLTLCGLLHDIGKIFIPDSIIKKPGKLTEKEYDIIKQHPLKGYEFLKTHQELDPRIAQAALMHHERCDGTGYPTGSTRNTIPDMAQIVAIADVYDAMTSRRVYRGPISPFKVIRILEEEGIQKYGPHYFLVFLEQIINTFINTDVYLSNGQKAHVIFINKHQLSRPVVQIADEILDLSKHPSLDIESIA